MRGLCYSGWLGLTKTEHTAVLGRLRAAGNLTEREQKYFSIHALYLRDSSDGVHNKLYFSLYAAFSNRSFCAIIEQYALKQVGEK